MSGSRRTAGIIEKLQMLAAVHDEAATLVREIAALLDTDNEPDADEPAATVPENPQGTDAIAGRNDHAIVDHDTLSIRWRGRTCCLGNTLAFWFFERLARCPGQLISHQQLLHEVWDGVRSKEAIRSVVKVLRQKLREAGMDELAAAVDGSSREHYGLKLP
jgi:DNA-binding response OmpR family regulator